MAFVPSETSHPDLAGICRLARARPSASHIAALRQRIDALSAAPSLAAGTYHWGLGVAEIDALLPIVPGANRPAAGLHEIKPAAHTDRTVAAGFAAALLARRLSADRRPVLWAFPARHRQEYGLPYGPGLARLGLAAERCLLVETRNRQETLWVLEEGLKSGAVAGVLGAVDELDTTPARRLVLAAAVPCFVLSDPARPGAPVAHTRWRVSSAPVARADTMADGRAQTSVAPLDMRRWRCRLALERCRHGTGAPSLGAQGVGAQMSENQDGWLLEWCDASFRFHLVAALADRAVAPRGRRSSAANGLA